MNLLSENLIFFMRLSWGIAGFFIKKGSR